MVAGHHLHLVSGTRPAAVVGLDGDVTAARHHPLADEAAGNGASAPGTPLRPGAVDRAGLELFAGAPLVVLPVAVLAAELRQGVGAVALPDSKPLLSAEHAAGGPGLPHRPASINWEKSEALFSQHRGSFCPSQQAAPGTILGIPEIFSNDLDVAEVYQCL